MKTEKERPSRRRTSGVTLYKVAIYRRNEDGVGGKCIKHTITNIKPDFRDGFWWDVTNGWWARWER